MDLCVNCFIFVNQVIVIKVKASEISRLAQIPLSPNNFDMMNKTMGKKMRERHIQIQFEYFGDSIAW